jgi:hypothetical protein
MPLIVDVIPGHFLCPLFTYRTLPFGDMTINSIQQGYGYFYLMHHGLPDKAKHLMEAREMAPFRLNPDRILPWVLQQVKEPNWNFVCQSDRIFKAIMVHQLVEREEESEFKKSFMYELVDVEDPTKVKFRVFNSNKEMIYSSGLRFDQWTDSYPGFHLYGKILEELVPLCLADQDSDPISDKDFWDLMDNPQLFLPPAEGSVLVVADSQPRQRCSRGAGPRIPARGPAGPRAVRGKNFCVRGFCGARIIHG